MLNEWVKKNRKQGKRKGITLVEVLVVIVILAVLTVSLSAKIGSYFDKPKELKVLNDMSYVRDAVILANGTNGLKSYGTLTGNALPTADAAKKLADDLNSVLDPSLKIVESATPFKIGFVDAKDPWNKPYTITMVGPANAAAGALEGIVISSGGADGAINGTDDYVMTIGFGVDEDDNTVEDGKPLGVHYGALPGQ